MPNEVVIHVKGSDETGPAFKSATQGASGFGSAMSVAVGIGLSQAPAAFGNIAKGLGDMTAAAADDEASVLRLKNAVENTGASWSAYSGKLDESVKAAQAKAFSDDEARSSLSLLMAQTGDADEAMRRLALAEDIARGANIPLEQAAKLTGKVTEENVNVFKKMGITLEAGASEAEAFAALQAKFGGQADTYAKSTAGQMEVAKIQMGELKEEAGGKLLPAMNKLTGVFMALPAPLQMGILGTKGLASALGPMSPALMAIVPKLGMVIAGTWSHVTALIAQAAAMIAANLPIVAAVAAIALLVAGIYLLIKHWDDVTAATKKFWEVIKELAGKFFDMLTGAFQAVLDFLKKHWPEIATILSGPFAPIVLLATDGFGVRSALMGAMDSVKTYVGDRINDIVGFFTGLPGRVSAALSALPDAISGGIKLGVNLAIGYINTLAWGWELVINTLAGLVNAIPDFSIPGWVPKIGGKSFGIPEIPTIALPRIDALAQGGIVTRPTLALLGESGTEVVAPLGQIGGLRGGDIIVHVHVQGSILSENNLETVIADALRHGKFRGMVPV